MTSSKAKPVGRAVGVRKITRSQTKSKRLRNRKCAYCKKPVNHEGSVAMCGYCYL